MLRSNMVGLKIVVLWGVIFFLSWHAFKPFLAERNYREGFNNTAIRRHSIGLRQMERAVRLAPLEVHYQSALGKAYESAAKDRQSSQEKERFLIKAMEMYDRAILLDNNNPWYRNRLAVSALKLSDVYKNSNRFIEKQEQLFNIAESSHRKAAQIDPNNPLFQLNLAFFLHKTHRFEESIDYYDRTLKIDDRMLEAAYNLADIYNRLDQPEKAITYYHFVYDRNPKFSNTLIALSRYYLDSGESDKAIEFLEKAHQLKKPNEQVMKNLIALYDRKKNHAKAIPIYESLFRRFPRNLETYHTFYIRSLLHNRSPHKAIASLERFLTHFPENDLAKRQLSSIKNAL